MLLPPIIKVAILAVIQGLTEFLPVSSSGHLVLAKHVMSFETPGALLEISLHAGTLISILVYYRKRIMRLIRGIFIGEKNSINYGVLILVSAIPAAVIGLYFEKKIESLFNKASVVLMALCVTGIVLLSLIRVRNHDGRLNNRKSLIIGIAQALAIIPGISRSGLTITCARHLGLSPESSAEFSLLMSIPVIIGASMLKCGDVIVTNIGVTFPELFVGIVISSFVGYFSIFCLAKALSSDKFWIFGIYCLTAGLLGVMVL